MSARALTLASVSLLVLTACGAREPGPGNQAGTGGAGSGDGGAEAAIAGGGDQRRWLGCRQRWCRRGWRQQ